MKRALLFIVLFQLFSCASEQAKKEDNAFSVNLKEEIRLTQALDERDVRTILYQAKKYWDAIHEHISHEQNRGTISHNKITDFTVQDREFTKYYENALMLYLRGDTSSDFCRSLVTIKQLFLIAESCYPDIKEDVSSLRALSETCVSVEPYEDDTKRTFLYKAKTAWNELNVKALGLQLRNKLTDGELQDFKSLDKAFADHYANACMLYLEGNTTSEDFESVLDTLHQINVKGKKLLP